MCGKNDYGILRELFFLLVTGVLVLANGEHCDEMHISMVKGVHVNNSSTNRLRLLRL